MNNESRAAFEFEYGLTYVKPFPLNEEGTYQNACTEHAWQMWQASRKVALDEAITACDELETNFSQAGARTESAVAGTCKYIIQELMK